MPTAADGLSIAPRERFSVRQGCPDKWWQNVRFLPHVAEGNLTNQELIFTFPMGAARGVSLSIVFPLLGSGAWPVEPSHTGRRYAVLIGQSNPLALTSGGLYDLPL